MLGVPLLNHLLRFVFGSTIRKPPDPRRNVQVISHVPRFKMNIVPARGHDFDRAGGNTDCQNPNGFKWMPSGCTKEGFRLLLGKPFHFSNRPQTPSR